MQIIGRIQKEATDSIARGCDHGTKHAQEHRLNYASRLEVAVHFRVMNAFCGTSSNDGSLSTPPPLTKKLWTHNIWRS